MSLPIIRVDHIGWPGTRDAQGPWPCDGVVTYEIRMPEGHRFPLYYMLQPFVLGAHRQDATGRISMKNLWGWDGNRDAPTLSPSFACEDNREGCLPVRVHLFLKAGRIELCSDSTVQLAP